MRLLFTKVDSRLIAGRTLVALFALLIVVSSAHAAVGVQIAWDPNPEDNIAGYRVYYGQVDSGVTNSVDVGLVTTGAVSDLAFATAYFFYVTAYNAFGLESDPSEILLHTTPAPISNPRPLSLTLDPYLIALSPSEVTLRPALDGDVDPTKSVTISWTQLFGPIILPIGNSGTLFPAISLPYPGLYGFQVNVSHGVDTLQTSTYIEVFDANAGGGSQYSIYLSPPTKLMDGIVYSWNSQPNRFYHIAYRKSIEDRFWVLAARNVGSQGDQTYWVDDYIFSQKQQGFFTVFEVP